jgi:hypothetical protein
MFRSLCDAIAPFGHASLCKLTIVGVEGRIEVLPVLNMAT